MMRLVNIARPRRAALREGAICFDWSILCMRIYLLLLMYIDFPSGSIMSVRRIYLLSLMYIDFPSGSIMYVRFITIG